MFEERRPFNKDVFLSANMSVYIVCIKYYCIIDICTFCITVSVQ